MPFIPYIKARSAMLEREIVLAERGYSPGDVKRDPLWFALFDLCQLLRGRLREYEKKLNAAILATRLRETRDGGQEEIS